jgi:hypothetical protein
MTLGLTLFAIGGLGLMATVFYGLIDKMKRGVLFRNKRIILSLGFGSGVLGLVGMLVVALSQQS